MFIVLFTFDCDRFNRLSSVQRRFIEGLAQCRILGNRATGRRQSFPLKVAVASFAGLPLEYHLVKMAEDALLKHPGRKRRHGVSYFSTAKLFIAKKGGVAR